MSIKIFSGKAFNELDVGDKFGAQLTVTEAHIVIASGLFGDFNPLHVNEEYCKDTRFGQRIMHGPMTGALMSAPIGNYFSGTVIAYLEQNCSFRLPVYPGDTLLTEWSVVGLIPKVSINGGLVELSGVCNNSSGEIVANASGKILLKNSVC